MVNKSILFNKIIRFKKSSLKKARFFSDQHMLKNQLSFDDVEDAEIKESETAEKLGEATQEVAKQKTKKKKIINIVTFC